MTLRHVAAEAQVSAMTVSNFMNGRFQLMSPTTRARLEATVARLNYRPHASGRGLRTDSGLSIGMIIVDESPTFLADPFITHVVAGLSNYLNQHGYGLVLQGLSGRDFSGSALIRDARTDGLCVMLSGGTAERRAILDVLVELHEPIVLFQEPPPRAAADICAIRQDERGGGEALGQHLLDFGAENLLFLAPALTWPAIVERVKGVRRALARSPGARLEVLACADGSFAASQAILDAHVRRHGFPDAIMGGNDQLGITALKVALAHGLKAPDDLLVTGYNAFEFWLYSDPVLTTVQSCAYEIGARGGAEIVDRLRTGAFPARDIVWPVGLRIGGSTQDSAETKASPSRRPIPPEPPQPRRRPLRAARPPSR